jgi:hypothetical protein
MIMGRLNETDLERLGFGKIDMIRVHLIKGDSPAVFL